MHVDEAIPARRSVRAFRFDPIPRETAAHLLEVTMRALLGNLTAFRES